MLPLVTRTARALSGWVGEAFGGGLELRPDLDGIEALSGEREALWARLEKASFLTQDEKRAAAGYGPGQVSGAGYQVPGAGSLALKYSPDQPRDELGRWTDGGGVAPGDDATEAEGAGGENERPRLADPKAPGIYHVDLKQEEGFGHTIKNHVAKTDVELVARLKAERYHLGPLTIYRWKYGTFKSLIDANDLVNRTLEENYQQVDEVATGRVVKDTIVQRFGRDTGRELFLPDPNSEPRFRTAHEVEVRIVHDASRKSGVRVRTAFPRNADPIE